MISRKYAGYMTEKPLSPVYLFDGDDILKRETLMERLSKRIAENGDLSTNSQVYLAKEIKNPNSLIDALNTMPFGALYRFVVIEEADHLDKDTQALLVTYIQQPSVTTILVLVADKLSRSSRLFKTIQEYFSSSIIDCTPKKASELPRLIRNIAQGEGVDIQTSAASLLLDRLGSDTVMLSNETRKLAAIVRARKDTVISDVDVDRHVVRLAEPKPWDLTNALSLKDLAQCLKLAGRMKSFTATGLFALCIARIREILSAKTLAGRGLSVAQAMGKQEWQIRELKKAIELFSYDELECILKQAPQIEAQMKSGADADQLLKLWIIDACA